MDKLIYWGSKTKNDDSVTLGPSKRGPKRRMSPEQELFIVLTRLRCGILDQDLTVRCKLSTSHISRICITWIDLLHSHLRAIPIWASRANIQSNMPYCFSKFLPKNSGNIGLKYLLRWHHHSEHRVLHFQAKNIATQLKVSLELLPMGQLPLFQSCILVGPVIKILQSTVVSYSY